MSGVGYPQPQPPPQQPPPPPPPPTGADAVADARPVTAGLEYTRSAWGEPHGQLVAAPDSAIGRTTSNSSPQVRQWYS